MDVTFKRIAYAHESGLRYFPIWRVDYEVDGKSCWREVQAQTAICAQKSMCLDLGVPFRLI